MIRYDIAHKPDPRCFDSAYELIQASFPADEYRPYDVLRAMLDWPTYAMYTCEDASGNVYALLLAHELDSMRFVESLCILPEKRGKGTGGAFLDEYIARAPQPVVLEVELPEDELTRRRIGFYKRHGLTMCNRHYIMPSLGPGRQPMPLKLMSTQPLDDNFDAVRDSIYRHVYRVSPDAIPVE